MTAISETVADFILAPGVAQLEEIVSVGYGTATRGELSTAVSSVGAEELANQPISSIDGALQGKAPVSDPVGRHRRDAWADPESGVLTDIEFRPAGTTPRARA